MATICNSTAPQAPPAVNEPFVNERQAARFLNVSMRTLQRWRVEPPAGDGPIFYRFGGRIAYRLSELSDWAAQHAFYSTSAADVGPSVKGGAQW